MDNEFQRKREQLAIELYQIIVNNTINDLQNKISILTAKVERLENENQELRCHIDDWRFS